MTDESIQRRERAGKAIRLGVAMIFSGILLLLVPLVTRHIALQQINRYVVAFGLLGICVGFSLILNGALDWRRAK